MPTQTSALLEARLRAVHARGRTAEALLGIALDVLEPYACDFLSPRDYQQLCDVVEAPVAAATEAAQASLSRELARVLQAADQALVARLEGLRHPLGLAAE